ncbi:SWI/SNF-related matrix-associated actin-dependent regulator of chromatin subfamily A-like protein 1 [Nymphaea thermarum]|nr:SWI/SNF-related matrix-associated actin-dependent regulator of chromatin subfamily A-like protein 1 [Nymphaea thermarum]
MHYIRQYAVRGWRIFLSKPTRLDLAIAIAACFMNEGPILVVCPAVLRFPWAEELESWLPFCAPKDIHLVFGHQDNVAYLTSCPKIIVVSYTMLHRLRKTMQERDWAVMIIDESHNVRCTKKMIESDEFLWVQTPARAHHGTTPVVARNDTDPFMLER